MTGGLTQTNPRLLNKTQKEIPKTKGTLGVSSFVEVLFFFGTFFESINSWRPPKTSPSQLGTKKFVHLKCHPQVESEQLLFL